MDYKGFFKLTISKVVVFIVAFLSFITFLLPVKSYMDAFPAIMWELKYVAYFNFYPYSSSNIFYFGVLLELLFSYLIACLLVFVYNKVKKS